MKSDAILDRELPAIIVRHQVQDFEKWRQVYDSLGDLRAQFGIVGDRVNRAGRDGNDVIVYHQAETRDELEKFLASAELRQAMSRAGVAGPRSAKWSQTPF